MPDLAQLDADDLAWLADFLDPREPADPAEHDKEIDAAIAELNETLPGNWREDARRVLALWGIVRCLWSSLSEGRTPVAGTAEDRIDRALAALCRELDAAAELQPDALPYYKVTASHDRVLSHSRPSFRSKFTSPIQAVRVELPLEPNPRLVISTQIGEVRADDHLAFSRQEIVAGYEREFRPPAAAIDRVDLITGGRNGVHRFCPVSVYIAYHKTSAQFFVLQSADFFGQKARLYFSQNMVGHPIITRSAFKPTPFSAIHNNYRFWMQENKWPENAPESFCLRGQLYYSGDPRRADDRNAQSLAMYMDMNMSYQLIDKPSPVSPPRAQCGAFARVCAIEDWKRRSHHQHGNLGRILHALGTLVGQHRLDWDVRGQPSST